MSASAGRCGHRERPAEVAAALIVTVVAFATACSHASSEPPSEFDAFASPYLDAARSAGASPEQVAALVDALDADEMTFEAYSGAVAAAFDCMDSAGVAHSVPEVDASRGFPFLVFSYEGGPEGNAIAEACVASHLDFVDSVYQLQPSSVAARDAIFDAALPTLIACLRDEGYAVSSDATADEVRLALDDMVTDTERISADPFWNPARCLIEAGVGGY